MYFSDPVLEARYVENMYLVNSRMGTQTLILVNVMFVLSRLLRAVGQIMTSTKEHDDECKTNKWTLPEAQKELSAMFVLTGLLYMNLRRPSTVLYVVLMVVYFGLCIAWKLPSLGVTSSCSDRLTVNNCMMNLNEVKVKHLMDCSLQGSTSIEFLISICMVSPRIIPWLKQMHFLWIWIAAIVFFMWYSRVPIDSKFVNLMKEQTSQWNCKRDNFSDKSQVLCEKVSFAMPGSGEGDSHYFFSFVEVIVNAIFLIIAITIAITKKRYLEKGQRNKFVDDQRQRGASMQMFHILEYMVPVHVIVPMLINPGAVIANPVDRCTILFVMICDFDHYARTLSPQDLLGFLNSHFSSFDTICHRNKVTKIETVGEEYVAAVGVIPEDIKVDKEQGHEVLLERLCRCGEEILKLQTPDGVKFKMGMHTGKIVAGVIGHKLPRFRLFGDTINTSARLMQKGLPGHLQFGEETQRLIPPSVRIKLRGEVEMKGKGMVKAWLLDTPSPEADGFTVQPGPPSKKSVISSLTRSATALSLQAADSEKEVQGEAEDPEKEVQETLPTSIHGAELPPAAGARQSERKTPLLTEANVGRMAEQASPGDIELAEGNPQAHRRTAAMQAAIGAEVMRKRARTRTNTSCSAHSRGQQTTFSGTTSSGGSRGDKLLGRKATRKTNQTNFSGSGGTGDDSDASSEEWQDDLEDPEDIARREAEEERIDEEKKKRFEKALTELNQAAAENQAVEEASAGQGSLIRRIKAFVGIPIADSVSDEKFLHWYHKTTICKKFASRMERQLLLYALLTTIEAGLLVYTKTCEKQHQLYDISETKRLRFPVYIVCRLIGLSILLGWRASVQSGWLYDKPKDVQMRLLTTYCFLAVLLYISYDALAQDEIFVHVNKTFVKDIFGGSAPPDDGYVCNPLLDNKTSVPDLHQLSCTTHMEFVQLEMYKKVIDTRVYEGPLYSELFMMMYFIVTTQHNLLFGHSLVYAVLGGVLMGISASVFKERWYFNSLGVSAFLLMASLNCYLAYAHEISSRSRYMSKRRLEVTQERIENILNTLMPPLVVEEIREQPDGATPPSHLYDRATVAQSDLCGFTKLAATKQPHEVVEFIGEIFGMFDDLTDKHEVYKVETIGDAYIAGQAAWPLTHRNSPISVALFGLDMIIAVSEWAGRRGWDIKCRVGVHTGQCIGGIIGTEMQRYHLFGDLMTVLEHLESTSVQARVQVSVGCREAILRQMRREGIPENLVIFEERKEPHLSTSKGEPVDYAEVGGRTYLMRSTVALRNFISTA